MAATAVRKWARCPCCGRRSRCVQSRYERTVADLPCGVTRVTLHLRARRFRCRVRWCQRRVCCERLPELVAPSARRTVRLRDHLLREAFALGGEPAPASPGRKGHGSAAGRFSASSAPRRRP